MGNGKNGAAWPWVTATIQTRRNDTKFAAVMLRYAFYSLNKIAFKYLFRNAFSTASTWRGAIL
jgi:hypothetical protein